MVLGISILSYQGRVILTNNAELDIFVRNSISQGVDHRKGLTMTQKYYDWSPLDEGA